LTAIEYILTNVEIFVRYLVNLWDDRGDSILEYIFVIFILSVGASFLGVIMLYAFREVWFDLMSIGG